MYACRRNCYGITPLHCAASSGSSKVFKEVISAGGDLRLHDYKGQDITFKIQEVPDAKKRQKLIGILERRKLYAEQLDPYSRSPLNQVILRYTDTG